MWGLSGGRWLLSALPASGWSGRRKKGQADDHTLRGCGDAGGQRWPAATGERLPDDGGTTGCGYSQSSLPRGVRPGDADELVCGVEAGAVAGAHCSVEELPGGAPGARGTSCGEGWNGGVDRAIDVLVSTVGGVYPQALTTSCLLAGGEILHERAAVASARAANATAVGHVPSPRPAHARAAAQPSSRYWAENGMSPRRRPAACSPAGGPRRRRLLRGRTAVRRSAGPGRGRGRPRAR